MTRPPTIGIAPTVTTRRPVKYRQKIDVAILRVPKPRKVTLEPVSTSKPKLVRRLTSTSNDDDRDSSRLSSTSKLDHQRRGTETVPFPVDESHRTQESPLLSGASSVSIATSGPKDAAVPPASRSSHSSQDPGASASQTSTGSKVITASFELQRGGALPGDAVPMTIQVQHTKPIRSLYGVVATLYRQARVDMHPNLPVTSGDRTRGIVKKEDYYPRSKTGLGGLSLAAAGSSQVWRKDLSQAIAPLYIDHQTLTATVRPVIHVPEDVFPTLSNAPGDMIAFRYFVEVMIDINGKCAGRTGGSAPDASSVHSAPPSLNLGNDNEETRAQPTASDKSPFYHLSTAKGAVKFQCELVIGSHDTAKNKGKGKDTEQTNLEQTGTGLQETTRRPHPNSDKPYLETEPFAPPSNKTQNDYDAHDFHYDYDYGYGYDYDPNYDPRYYDYYNANTHNPDTGAPWPSYSQGQELFAPPPPLPQDSELSEKERLRRAEETLYPSRPPGVVDHARNGDSGPSAPFIPNDGYLQAPDMHQSASQPTSLSMPAHTSGLATPTTSHRPRIDGAVFDTPSTDYPAPSYSAAASENAEDNRSQDGAPTDDKQDLERRRLQAQTSSPDHDGTHAVSAIDASANLPSAPSISAVGDIDTGNDAGHQPQAVSSASAVHDVPAATQPMTNSSQAESITTSDEHKDNG